MAEVPFTILDEGRATEVPAQLAGERVRLSSEALERSLGWESKPQGLCRGDVCVPTAGRPGLVSDGQIDLAAFAELLQRPLAVDLPERAASLGASARERAEVLRGGVAPDFTLPDLAGREWTLSGLRGKKVLLIAYASW
jgi:hypothetical protein